MLRESVKVRMAKVGLMDKVIHIEYLRSIIVGVCNINSNPEFYSKCRHHLLQANNINKHSLSPRGI